MDEMTLNVRTAAVRVDGLSRRYGATRALDEVDLTLERGITGLLGPNGAGKTTLLSILATVDEPDAGRVSVFGLDPRIRPSGWRSAAGSATSPRSWGITGTSQSPGSWTTSPS